jgi:predicted HD phosphohydrolase
MTDLLEKTAQFHTMSDGTQEDWDIIMTHMKPFSANGGARVLDHLRLLEGDCGGFAVDRLTHCLQTATRAFATGARGLCGDGAAPRYWRYARRL